MRGLTAVSGPGRTRSDRTKHLLEVQEGLVEAILAPLQLRGDGFEGRAVVALLAIQRMCVGADMTLQEVEESGDPLVLGLGDRQQGRRVPVHVLDDVRRVTVDQRAVVQRSRIPERLCAVRSSWLPLDRANVIVHRSGDTERHTHGERTYIFPALAP